MAKVLYDYDLPDMRKKRSIPQLAQEVLEKNRDKVMTAYNRTAMVAFGPVPSPIEILSAEIERQMEKTPGITQKEAVIKALNTRMFSTREEVYARNTMDMLKRTGKYDELRKLAGWNKGIKTDLFEYDENIGYLVYANQFVIYHDEDYYTDDGLRIIPIEEYQASAW